jgi:hypothetical protein
VAEEGERGEEGAKKKKKKKEEEKKKRRRERTHRAGVGRGVNDCDAGGPELLRRAARRQDLDALRRQEQAELLDARLVEHGHEGAPHLAQRHRVARDRTVDGVGRHIIGGKIKSNDDDDDDTHALVSFTLTPQKKTPRPQPQHA